MIKKECAIEIKKNSLRAISELSQILIVIQGNCSDEEYDQLKKGVGLSIGKIQTDILDILYEEHPELDDLKSIKE